MFLCVRIKVCDVCAVADFDEHSTSHTLAKNNLQERHSRSDYKTPAVLSRVLVDVPTRVLHSTGVHKHAP